MEAGGKCPEFHAVPKSLSIAFAARSSQQELSALTATGHKEALGKDRVYVARGEDKSHESQAFETRL